MSNLLLKAGLAVALAAAFGCKSRERVVDSVPVPAAGPPPMASPIATERKVTAAPKGTPAYDTDAMTKAEVLVREGKAREAIELLRGVVAANPKEVRAFTLLGEAYKQEKRALEALDAYGKALALEPKYPPALVGACRLRAERGEARPAVEVCEGAMAVAKDDLEITFALALSYMQDAKAERALPLLEKVAAARPKAADVLVPLGRTNLYLRRYAEAKKALSAALAVDQSRTLAKELLARALYELGDHKGALRRWKEVIAAEPTNQGALRSLAIALRQSDDPASAASELHELARKHPEDAVLLRELASVEIAAERWKAAIGTLEKIALRKEATPIQLHNLGYAHAKEGAHGKAADILAEAVKRAPERRDTRLLYGIELGLAGRKQESAAALEALVREAPTSVEAERAREALRALPTEPTAP